MRKAQPQAPSNDGLDCKKAATTGNLGPVLTSKAHVTPFQSGLHAGRVTIEGRRHKTLQSLR
jgi:hypothetical protein